MKQINHYIPLQFSDRVALAFTKDMRFFADTFFKSSATLRDVVIAVRNDEAHHCDTNHHFANDYDK